MLIPCPACTRHFRDHETSCPFCKVPLDVVAIAALATALALAGCKDGQRERGAEIYGAPPVDLPAPTTPDAGAPDSGKR